MGGILGHKVEPKWGSFREFEYLTNTRIIKLKLPHCEMYRYMAFVFYIPGVTPVPPTATGAGFGIAAAVTIPNMLKNM